ncbi:Lipopolysaccharide biosynthesis protein WzxC [Mucinivorans hirudinis]|uniref:Lipopolysaccharide biosynthesis protein WzxC n=1 Tax=Mucinivorans hirudinis TaxID=1433126 RepID=A0A060REL5_9BACT|nr:Lipopolysaccharide biosynthesis protein WzxC [Mucinivorans hirudinis]
MEQRRSLKSSALRGVFWSGVDKIFSKLFFAIIGLLLARVLLPEDYGLVGMLTIFLAVSQLLIDSGFSQALVQRHNPTQTDYSTAFFFNIFVGVGCYLLLFFAAPFIADFYEAPSLILLLRVMSISLVTNSLTVVQRAKLLVNIDFRRLALINVCSVTMGSTSALVAAYNGWGVWALAVQAVVTGVVTMVMYWVTGGWMPSIVFSKDSFRTLFKFGSKLLAAGFLATVVNNLYNLIIGKLYHKQELGYYQNGRQLSENISSTINDIINSVTFPLLSAIKEDRGRLIDVYSRMLAMTAFIIFPVMTLAMLLAEPFVISVLTEKWLPAVPIIQWLCMARMFTPISSLNMNILNAVGRSDLFMKVDLLKLPLTLVAMAITLPISIDAVVIGNFIVTFVCYFINAYLPGKMFGFGIVAQTKIFAKTILSTLIMAVTLILVCSFVDNNIVKLVVGIVVGLLSFVGAAWVLKIAELREVLLIIKKVVKR